MLPAITAGMRKSNMSSRLKPISAATETTSRFVEVPMVVHVPPSKVASPMGIRTEEAFILVRSETLINMGRNNTTTGTLLMKAQRRALSPVPLSSPTIYPAMISLRSTATAIVSLRRTVWTASICPSGTSRLGFWVRTMASAQSTCRLT